MAEIIFIWLVVSTILKNMKVKREGLLPYINSGKSFKIHVPKSGWWYTYPSEKYEFVSWDDDIPN